jgi:hypothetical protein
MSRARLAPRHPAVEVRRLEIPDARILSDAAKVALCDKSKIYPQRDKALKPSI